MAKLRTNNPVPAINASIWLKDAQRFTILQSLDHSPTPGEILAIEEERWRVVEWIDQIECERVVN